MKFLLASWKVLGIRNRIRIFLSLPDPDPLVRGTDPDPYPFLINVLSGLKQCLQNKMFHKILAKNYILKVSEERSRIRIRIQ
jgi:hypothetical protein